MLPCDSAHIFADNTDDLTTVVRLWHDGKTPYNLRGCLVHSRVRPHTSTTSCVRWVISGCIAD